MASAYRYDDSVAKGVEGLISANSPLMKQASQRGLDTANKRGLLNSSIAVGAAHGAVLDRAVPIATADANIGAQKNLQAADIVAQMDRLRTQAGFTKELQTSDINAQMERLNAANAAEMSRLQASLANANAQQRVAIEARIGEIAAQTEANSRLQSEANTQQLGRMSQEFNQQLSVLDRQNANTLQQIQAQGDQEMRRQTATIAASLEELRMNLASGDRQQALQAATNLHVASQQLQAQIMANTNIDAASRQQWLAYAQQQASIGLNLLSQIQGVQINYGQSVPNAPPPPGAGLLNPGAVP